MKPDGIVQRVLESRAQEISQESSVWPWVLLPNGSRLSCGRLACRRNWR